MPSPIQDKNTTTRLENVRLLRGGTLVRDPLHAACLNRVMGDVERRTKDLHSIDAPARAFLVKQSSTPDDSVLVNAGWIPVDTDLSAVTDVIEFVETSVGPIAAAPPNSIRMDLVYLDMTNQTVFVRQGTEVAASTGFESYYNDPTPLRPTLADGNQDSIPLAYLYVDQNPTAFSDTIAINNAGHIRDVRPAAGMDWRPWGSDGADLVADTTAGSIGSVPKLARSNHRHPLNAPQASIASLTRNIEADAAAIPGTEGTYARRDHKHTISVSASLADLKVAAENVVTGQIGSSISLARADHRHPLNFPSSPILPGISQPGSSSIGTGFTYARDDHSHQLLGDLVVTMDENTLEWGTMPADPAPITLETGTKTTAALAHRPAFAIIMAVGNNNFAPASEQVGYISFGVVIAGNPPSWQKCVGSTSYHNHTLVQWGSMIDQDAAVGRGPVGNGYNAAATTYLTCNYLLSSGCQMTPNANFHGRVSIVSFGFVDVLP